jgi:hypothetical protein
MTWFRGRSLRLFAIIDFIFRAIRAMFASDGFKKTGFALP